MDTRREIEHMKARAAMALSSRRSKPLREAMVACEGAPGLIDILGIYDLEDGKSSFRFLVVMPGDAEPSLRFFDIRGDEVHAPVRQLSKEKIEGLAGYLGAIVYVLSAELACAIDFSFRMHALGKLVMVDPDARVTAQAKLEQLLIGYSHLSQTPGDLGKLWSRWGEEYRTDVLANPNYTLGNSYFNLKLTMEA